MANDNESVKAVERAKNPDDDRDICLSSGVVLRVKSDVNPMVFLDIMTDMDKNRPTPPTVYVESLGRYEENPDHPDYVSRVKAYDAVYASRMNDALILLGTEFKSTTKKCGKPEDDEWIEEMELLGIHINRMSKAARYLGWVKRVAVRNAKDMLEIQRKAGRIAGVSEEDVAAAAKSFPS